MLNSVSRGHERDTAEDQGPLLPGSYVLALQAPATCTFASTWLFQGTQGFFSAQQLQHSQLLQHAHWPQYSVAGCFPLYLGRQLCSKVPPVRHLSMNCQAPWSVHFTEVPKGKHPENSASAAAEWLLNYAVRQSQGFSNEVWISALEVGFSLGAQSNPGVVAALSICYTYILESSLYYLPANPLIC